MPAKERVSGRRIGTDGAPAVERGTRTVPAGEVCSIDKVMPAAWRDSNAVTLSPPCLRLLVCGTAERGDDGAALAAVAHLLPELGADVSRRIEIRRCMQLDPADLIDLAPSQRCLIVDTAIGVSPGGVGTIQLREIATGADAPTPRSSRGLPLAEMLRAVDAARGSIPEGSFIGIGGRWFGYGRRFSRAVTAGLPEFRAAIRLELVRLAGVGDLAVSAPG
jgi:hydrogenase maturation protease